ncbi:hypothetical protein PVAG01_10610 [Phlyctema vagabunda]|uniref:Uncharacterized protein n=1 Tax=Phlyctema vagabunda TaxID=108571 RepID=A0ABR4P2S0_9HELO
MADYQKILNEGSESGDDTCRCPSACSKKQNRNLMPWIWCGVCTVITILAVVFAICKATVGSEKLVTRNRHPTDFVSAPDIGYTPKYFYNYYDFNPVSHELEFNVSAGRPLYAGKPTEQMDKAWDELIEGSYMMLSDNEKEKVQSDAPWELETIDDKVYMEVGVFHDLHCLNLLRKTIEPDHYNVHTDFTGLLQEKYKRVHIYHCIEHLRQSLQCHGDLTPVPLFSANKLPGTFLSHSLTHTCRDFDAIKRWRDDRNKENEPFSYW